MRIKEIVSIGGLSGLYKMETQKVNGMIVTSLTEGWTKFISNREHLFSPLENISIYTSDENVDFADVMIAIHNQIQTVPIIDSKSDNKDLREWFVKIIPAHDQEKVYVSDIRKIIKWYEILSEKGVIDDEIAAREEAKKAEAEKEAEKEEATKDPAISVKEDPSPETEEGPIENTTPI
ncbi:MAG: DUF5606 domain-containing protein [Chitinophagales bacterium]|nr:DUF5606 domain-containing protein [Chitinophagales bacterium]